MFAMKRNLLTLFALMSAFGTSGAKKVGGFMWAWDPLDHYNRTRELTLEVANAMVAQPKIHDFLAVMLGNLDVRFNGEINETIFVADEKLIEINAPIFRNRPNGTEIYMPIGQIPTRITNGGIPYGHQPKDWFVIDPNDKRFNLDRFFSELIPFMRKFGLSGLVLDDESFCAPRIEADEVEMWFKYVNLLGSNLHKHGLSLKVFIVCPTLMKVDNITQIMNRSTVDVWISMETYSGDFDFWKENVDFYKPLGEKFSPGLYPVTLEQPTRLLSRDVLNLYASYLLVAAPKVQEIWLFCYPLAYQDSHLYSAMAYWRDTSPEPNTRTGSPDDPRRARPSPPARAHAAHARAAAPVIPRRAPGAAGVWGGMARAPLHAPGGGGGGDSRAVPPPMESGGLRGAGAAQPGARAPQTGSIAPQTGLVSGQ
jgi:hypothetical protein